MSGHNGIYWVDLGIFPVNVGFCPNKKAWKAQMKEMGIKDEKFPSTAGHCSTFDWNGGKLILVTIIQGGEDNHSPVQVIGLLVHEATHVWQEVKQYIGETNPGTETEAYAMQRISMELIQGFNETRKQIA